MKGRGSIKELEWILVDLKNITSMNTKKDGKDDREKAKAAVPLSA